MQVHIPALHPQSKLTTLWCDAKACIVVNFWDLISAPALVDVKISCLGLWFTDHSLTAPPAAAAALQRGNLNACIKVETDAESFRSLPSEIAIMGACGMQVQSWEENAGNRKAMTLELVGSTPAVTEVMWDVRRSADLPFSPGQLRLEDDSYLEHALHQQAWHAQFQTRRFRDSYDLEEPGLLSVF